MARERIDLTGIRKGKITVVCFSYRRRQVTGATINYWKCKCDCGKIVFRSSSYLGSRENQSCGCETIKKLVARSFKHGLRKTKAYASWQHMMSRCYNKKNKDYYLYGKRGIKVCKKWHDITNFYKDMGERPEGHSIERIDYNKNYTLKNCKWIPLNNQGKNTRKVRVIVIDGKKLSARQAAKYVGKSVSAFNNWCRYRNSYMNQKNFNVWKNL